jgi:glycosyltransferase involved in cell wall biosynthesis
MVLSWSKSSPKVDIVGDILVEKIYIPRLLSILRHPMVLYLSLYMLYIIKKHKIRIIHAHDYLPGLSAALAGMLSRVPVVVTFHLPIQYTTFYLPAYLSPFVLFEKILKSCFDNWVTAIICVSNFTLRQTIDLGFSNSRTIMIHNWVKFSPSTNRRKSKVDLRKFKLCNPYILSVGRLSEKQKCFSLLIPAFKLLLAEGHNLDLIIVGDGPDKEAYQKYARLCGVDKKIHFLSNVNEADLATLYTSCELFVFPSSIEGLPLVLLEAMVYGKPIVATKVGGVPEVVKDNYNGLLVSPDPKSIFMAMNTILRSSNLKTVFGKRSAEIVLKSFSPLNLETTLTLLEKISEET